MSGQQGLSAHIAVNLTPKELLYLSVKAKAEGRSISSMIRKMVTDALGMRRTGQR